MIHLEENIPNQCVTSALFYDSMCNPGMLHNLHNIAVLGSESEQLKPRQKRFIQSIGVRNIKMVCLRKEISFLIHTILMFHTPMTQSVVA